MLFNKPLKYLYTKILNFNIHNLHWVGCADIQSSSSVCALKQLYNILWDTSMYTLISLHTSLPFHTQVLQFYMLVFSFDLSHEINTYYTYACTYLTSKFTWWTLPSVVIITSIKIFRSCASFISKRICILN